MRKFFYCVLLFMSIFITLFVFYEILTFKYIFLRADFKLESNPHYIVLGHSHPECAFNDSLISNFSNLAQSGESNFYTFQKVKEVLKQNKSIKTIFIEFTNNQIFEDSDKWIWGDKYISNRYPLYSSFMNMEDNKLLLNNNYKGFYNAFSISSKNKFLRIIKNDFNYTKEIGGYNYLNKHKTDSLLNNTKNINGSDINLKDNFKISKFNILYLQKIINLSNNHNTRIVLIRSPLHERYSGYFNETVYQKILKSNFKNVEYLDLSKFSLRNEDFWDLEHLNFRGARKFSLWFDSLIKSGLIDKPINQQEIDEKIEEYRTEGEISQ